MNHTDIKTSVIDKLREKVPGVSIPATEIEQGFDPPAFFVQLIPITYEKLNKHHNLRIVTINIHYFTKDKKDNDNLKMAQTLEKVFKSYLRVGDRKINIGAINPEIVDNVLQFMFDLSYVDGEESVSVSDTYGIEHVVVLDEEDNDLGYTETNVEIMQELEIE